MATMFQNILMTALPIYFGRINDARDVAAYNKSLFSLRLLAIGGVFCSTMVMIVDFKTGKRLHLPENHEDVLEAKLRST